MKITMTDLHNKLSEFLRDVNPADANAFTTRFSEFYQFALDNYENLDDEAKARVDKVSVAVRQQAKAAVEAMPEGPLRRQGARLLAIAEGSHFRAEDLLKILEVPPQDYHAVLKPARELSVQLLQHILDVMYDVSRHSHEGPASFAKIGLFFWAVDELLVALHLAQRAFTNQAYSHIRTVFEILDKVELFHVQPKWAQLWVGGDDRKAWNELKPSEVRKKLGEPKFDPMYGFFSEVGAHGTFKGLQARGGRRPRRDPATRPGFTLWIGGCPMEHHIVWSNSMCVYAVLKTLVKAVGVFEQYLNTEEAANILDSRADDWAKFFAEHLVRWAEREGLDAKPMIDFLNAKSWKRQDASSQR